MRSILFFIIVLISTANSYAQQQLVRQVFDTKSNTWVEVTSLFGKLPGYGFAPIRIEINNGTQSEKSFTLEFTSSNNASYGSSTGSRMNSSFSCVCAPGSKETYDFLVPLTTIFQTGGYGIETGLSFQLISNAYPSTSGSMSTEIRADWPSVLLSNTLYVPNASSLTSHLNTSTSASSYGNLQFAGDFNPKAMPTDWRAYLGQDDILLTSDDWLALDPGASTAILEWVRFGGQLTIYTSNTSDNLASLQIDESAASANTIQRSLGKVTLLPLPSSKRIDPKTTTRAIQSSSKSTGITFNSLLHDYSGTWPLQVTLGTKNFNTAFFVLILLAFGILVGPVNLFVFAKSGQRHRLFITTPIISLGASLVLIVIIMFQDGFGGRGHRVVLMEIQPQENNAYIIQEQAARTGVLLSSSFETSEPTLITPVALAPSRWARVILDGSSPNSYTANHGEHGLKVSGDWFQSRSIHGHLLQSLRPTRAHIKLSSKAGPPVLTSNFDFDLGTLFYQTPDRAWWRTDALKKGQSVTLTPSSDREFSTWIKGRGDLFSKQNAKHLQRLTRQPDRFFTTTENASGIDTYDSIKWLTTTTVITGPMSR